MLLDDFGANEGARSSTAQAFDMDDRITNLAERNRQIKTLFWSVVHQLSFAQPPEIAPRNNFPDIL
jgi:hypothetical protein